MILVCGEALIDLVPRAFGETTAYVPVPGGSPLNVAVGLGRLDVPVGFLGRVSHDAFGRRLRAHLAASGVDLRCCREGPELSTLAVVHLAPGHEPEYGFYGDGTADVRFTPDELPTELPQEVTALHFGSISLVREPGATTFERLMEREHGRRLLSLDPNVRPGLIADRDAYVRRLEHWVGLADLVKVSHADLAWLYPGLAPDAAADRWLALGPGVVVVTLGADGAMGVTVGGVRAAADGHRIAVADTVGAGDACTSGLLAWLETHGRLTRDALRALSMDDLASALAQGTLVAALTCTRIGAEPPTRAELAAAERAAGSAASTRSVATADAAGAADAAG